MYYQYAYMLPELARFVPKLGPGHRASTDKHSCKSCPHGRTGKDHELSGSDRLKAATYFLPGGHSMTKKERERIVAQFLAETILAKVGQDQDADAEFNSREAMKETLEQDHEDFE